MTYHDSRPVVDYFDGPVISDIWSAPRIDGVNATYGFSGGELIFSSGITTVAGGGASFNLSTWPLVSNSGSYAATLNFSHDVYTDIPAGCGFGCTSLTSQTFEISVFDYALTPTATVQGGFVLAINVQNAQYSGLITSVYNYTVGDGFGGSSVSMSYPNPGTVPVLANVPLTLRLEYSPDVSGGLLELFFESNGMLPVLHIQRPNTPRLYVPGVAFNLRTLVNYGAWPHETTYYVDSFETDFMQHRYRVAAVPLSHNGVDYNDMGGDIVYLSAGDSSEFMIAAPGAIRKITGNQDLNAALVDFSGVGAGPRVTIITPHPEHTLAYILGADKIDYFIDSFYIANGSYYDYTPMTFGSGDLPVAVIDATDVVTPGEMITLSGALSTDADSSPGTNDDIVSFEWYIDVDGTGTITQDDYYLNAATEGVSVGPRGESILLDTTGLPGGKYWIMLRVIDSTGQMDSTGKQMYLVPNTYLEPQFDDYTAADTLMVPLYSDYFRARFWCTLLTPTTEITESCTSPYRIDMTEQGAYSLSVTATVDDLVWDPTPATASWIRDSIAPILYVTGPTGAIPDHEATVTILVNEPGSLQCYLNGIAVEPCTESTALSGFEDGQQYIFTVTALDYAGNVSTATLEWYVVPPPDTYITSHPAATSTGMAEIFTFESDSPSATFECSLNGAAYTVCRSPMFYTGLAGGVHVFAVRAVGDLGLTDPTPATYTWTASNSIVNGGGGSSNDMVLNGVAANTRVWSPNGDGIQDELAIGGTININKTAWLKELAPKCLTNNQPNGSCKKEYEIQTTLAIYNSTTAITSVSTYPVANFDCTNRAGSSQTCEGGAEQFAYSATVAPEGLEDGFYSILLIMQLIEHRGQGQSVIAASANGIAKVYFWMPTASEVMDTSTSYSYSYSAVKQPNSNDGLFLVTIKPISRVPVFSSNISFVVSSLSRSSNVSVYSSNITFESTVTSKDLVFGLAIPVLFGGLRTTPHSDIDVEIQTMVERFSRAESSRQELGVWQDSPYFVHLISSMNRRSMHFAQIRKMAELANGTILPSVWAVESSTDAYDISEGDLPLDFGSYDITTSGADVTSGIRFAPLSFMSLAITNAEPVALAAPYTSASLSAKGSNNYQYTGTYSISGTLTYRDTYTNSILPLANATVLCLDDDTTGSDSSTDALIQATVSNRLGQYKCSGTAKDQPNVDSDGDPTSYNYPDPYVLVVAGNSSIRVVDTPNGDYLEPNPDVVGPINKISEKIRALKYALKIGCGKNGDTQIVSQTCFEQILHDTPTISTRSEKFSESLSFTKTVNVSIDDENINQFFTQFNRSAEVIATLPAGNLPNGTPISARFAARPLLMFPFQLPIDEFPSVFLGPYIAEAARNAADEQYKNINMSIFRGRAYGSSVVEVPGILLWSGNALSSTDLLFTLLNVSLYSVVNVENTAFRMTNQTLLTAYASLVNNNRTATDNFFDVLLSQMDFAHVANQNSDPGLAMRAGFSYAHARRMISNFYGTKEYCENIRQDDSADFFGECAALEFQQSPIPVNEQNGNFSTALMASFYWDSFDNGGDSLDGLVDRERLYDVGRWYDWYARANGRIDAHYLNPFINIDTTNYFLYLVYAGTCVDYINNGIPVALLNGINTMVPSACVAKYHSLVSGPGDPVVPPGVGVGIGGAGCTTTKSSGIDFFWIVLLGFWFMRSLRSKMWDAR